MLYFWMILFIAFAIIEVCTAALVSIWFLPGALISGVLAAFDLPIWLQMIVFFVISVVLLVFTKPLADRLLRPKRIATNADRVIGEIALVTEEINAIQGTGAIKVLGKIWSAKTDDRNACISVGKEVRILRVEGVTLFQMYTSSIKHMRLFWKDSVHSRPFGKQVFTSKYRLLTVLQNASL